MVARSVGLGALGALVLAGCSLFTNISGFSDGEARVGGVEAGPDSQDAAPTTSDSTRERDAEAGLSGSRYAEAVLQDQPFVYWRLGDRSAPLVDTAGRASIALSPKGVTFGAAGALSGDPDTATSFDGLDGRLVYAQTSATLSPTFSVELWARLRVNDTHVRFLLSYSSPATQADGVQLYFGPDFTILSRTVGQNTAYAAHNVPPTAGRYQHLVGTFDGALLRLYVDGVERDAASSSGTISAPDAVLTFGDSSVGQYFKFDGELDELAMYPLR